MSYSETWPRSGMTRNGQAFERPPLALRTVESGCSSWPTPNVSNGGRNTKHAVRRGNTLYTEDGKKVQESLEAAAKLWPTPDAAAMNSGTVDPERMQERRERAKQTSSAGNGFGLTLGTAAALWPTATATDAKASGAAGYSTQSGRHSGTTLTDATRQWGTPRASDATRGDCPSERGRNTPSLVSQSILFHQAPPTTGAPSRSGSTRRLNAIFATWLMGWPHWWVTPESMPCAASAMASWRSRQLSLLDYFCVE